MKLRFQREQRARIVFQKQKRTAKIQNFQERGFYGTFNRTAEGGRKKERKGLIIFILNQGRIENPAKSRRLYSQKRFIVDI